MIAGLSPSLSTALRTAGQARATMDDMARQIATGQRVSSVKDDGAAWARAAAARSELVQWESRGGTLDRLDMAMAYTKGVIEQHLDLQKRMRDVLISIRGTAVGSSARTNLAAEWNALLAQGKGMAVGANPGMANDAAYLNDPITGIGQQMGPGDSFWAGNRWAAYSDMSSWAGHYSTVNPGWGLNVAVDAVNVATANDAALDQLSQSLNVLIGQYNPASPEWNTAWLQQIGADEALSDRLRTRIDSTEARLTQAIGALTDADLGRASTARANADTRQQLALATVRQALDAYGAFAGGLLGNVQRTQRALA